LHNMPNLKVRIPEKDSIYFFNFTSSSLSLRCLLPRFSYSFFLFDLTTKFEILICQKCAKIL